MGGHDQLTAPLDACLEGHHLAIHHLLPRLLSRGVTEVCVGLRVTMTGEVLDAASDTRIVQTLQIAGHHLGCHLRVVAEGTGTDDDILGIGVHIGYGCKVDIKAVMLQIGADGVAALVGILRVARSADGSHRLILLHIEIGVVGEARHTSTLLVDAEQGMSVQCPYLRDQLCQLCLVVDIPCVEDESANGVVGIHVAHGLIHLMDRILLKV